MDWKLISEFAGLGITLIAFLIVFLRKMDSRFDSMDKSQSANYHNIDKRMHGIEMIVSPYQQEIKELKENQQANMLKISKVESCNATLQNGLERVERQVEALQARK